MISKPKRKMRVLKMANDHTEGLGLIDHCPTAGCGFRCCKKTGQVYGVILYPDELEGKSEENIKHLKV
jgi:hypothetical protein